MQFPDGFVKKYETILGDEARAFLASFDDEAVSAFRINPLKESQVSFQTLFQIHLGATMVRFLESLQSM